MEDILSALAWGVMILFLVYISVNANKQNLTAAEEERKKKEKKTEEEKEDGK